jgi:myo-inositol-1(or 4)-monophosphatase
MPPGQPASDARPSPAALRLIAEHAARTGGRIARGYFGRVSAVRLKGDRSEVCDADEAAQAAIVAELLAQRPEDALLTEETLRLPAGQESPALSGDRVCWVIDPLDGTRNFVRGIPLYACSVAAMLDGWPICGAIFDPVREVLYSAGGAGGLVVAGAGGALAEDIRARLGGSLGRPVVGIPSSPKGPVAPIAHRWLDRFVCRSLGSTALQLAWVASGELDATLSDNARLWDITAGWTLVTAAGGRVTSPEGRPLFPLAVQAYRGGELPALAARAGFPE